MLCCTLYIRDVNVIVIVSGIFPMRIVQVAIVKTWVTESIITAWTVDTG